ncbi:MAG: type I glyceraldehyde-3-phosphate dehydrogenase [Firmicutes bacterium]|nr:type I glyceraldehyde-3-phosphate dehydrogenase [Bacillota bacterium]
MKDIKVAINGFGRIGRLAFRLMFGEKGYEVVAINNRTYNPEMLAHLLKYDSTQGRYHRLDDVTVDGDCMVVCGKRIKFYSETDATKLPWGELGVDVVLECTGSYTTVEKTAQHIAAGAKKVVLSAPAKDAMPTIVYNVNHETLKATDTIISAASCTTNCLAPMAKALNDLCKIERGFMTTIHAYTGDQNALDGTHKGDFRRARAAAINIVPNTTGAAKAIGLVIPELKGKLDGAAQRVPVATGSLTELTAVVCGTVTAEEINAYMKSCVSETYWYTDEPIVSSDVIGTSCGSLFDATQTRVMPMEGNKSLVKVVAWYDNEMGYTYQMVRTIKYMCGL